MPPLGYFRECGPGALAALAGITADEAARVLWPLRRPPPGVCPPLAGLWGTWPLDLADALVRLGFGVELFDGAGVPWTDAAATRRTLARRAELAARTVQRLPPARPARRPARGSWAYAIPVPAAPAVSAIPAAEFCRPLTVAAWLRQFRGSGWVLFVRGHILAARNAEITAGGHTFGRYHVRDALRVLNPKGK